MLDTRLNVKATIAGFLPSASARVSTLSGWFVRNVRNFMSRRGVLSDLPAR